MNNGKTIGMILFFGGIALLIVYGLILGFEGFMQSIDFISGLLIGVILIGLLTLIISIYIEQKKDTKKTMGKIKKEDLEP
ncbi:MAG: hypothetical protein QCI00_02855 [Candidatus Thermoplasmatota archaeon]|nr:hypothetical protein [Candidatus Thermoplasmatota archaeon]